MAMRYAKFVLGDWSRDGHSQTQEYVIKVNLTREQMNAAYKAATKKIGFDFEEAASEYEEPLITMVQGEKLKQAGVKYPKSLQFDHDSYLRTYLSIIRKGNDSFRWKFLTMDEYNIGGYGLFHL